MLHPLARLAPVMAVLALALAGCGNLGDPRVAATVNGEPIPRSTLQEHYETVAGNPRLAQQLRADESGQLRGQVQAQVLTELVAAALVRQGAAALGVEIDQDDVAMQRQQLVEQVGGESALQQAIARQGLSEAEVERLLRDRAYRQAVTAELVAEDAATQQASQAFTEWLVQRRDGADIEVNPEFGRWDPESGSVVAEVRDADAAARGRSGARAPASPQRGAGANRGAAGDSRDPQDAAGS